MTEIKIPSLTGCLEAGLTSRLLDASLPDEQKLPILFQAGAVATLKEVKITAAYWASRQFQDATAKGLFVNGVCAAIDCGIICYTGTTDAMIPDGDWRKVITFPQITEADYTAISELVSEDELRCAIKVIIATKVNWWSMNHHTGQNEVQGYVKKVLNDFYPNNESEQVIKAAHSLGHIVSTLKILSLAGIAGIRLSTAIISAKSSLLMSASVKLKFETLPAGTARLGIAYATAKRLLRNVYAKYCPDVTDFQSIPETVATIARAPAKYHIQAFYLTGEARATYADTDANAFLGRLGTFINILYKRTSLAKSPYLAWEKVQDYDDYNPEYTNTLIRIQQAQKTAKGREAAAHWHLLQTVSEESLAVLRSKYLSGPGPNYTPLVP